MMSLAQDAPTALVVLRTVRAAARAEVWSNASPIPWEGRIMVELDATIVASHSEIEGATARRERTFGFYPLLAFIGP
jgi:hypothetical protein